MVLFALLASACTTEDGDGDRYDIPGGLVIDQASLEIEPDGSPVVFAQVRMYYATSATLSEWESRYQARNVQCIAYTPGAGGWVAHSFRNLQPYSGSSFLIRNAKGEAQAIIEHLHRLTLYAHKGPDWVVKKTIPEVAGGYGGYGFNFPNNVQAVMVGDSAWETPDQPVAGNPPHPELAVKRNDGSLIVLDTAYLFGNSLMLPGIASNYLILSSQPQYYDSLQTQQIICYRWSLDPLDPNPRKQVLQLDHRAAYGQFFSSQVQGETRIYYQLSQDSLAEFALRDDSLSWLGYRISQMPADTSQSSRYKQYLGAALGVDPLGCLQSINITGAGRPASSDTLVTLTHSSSCEAAIDTVTVPLPAPGPFQPPIVQMRFAPDGSLMLSLAMVKLINTDYTHPDDALPPSWLYLGRRSAAGKWTWEQIASY